MNQLASLAMISEDARVIVSAVLVVLGAGWAWLFTWILARHGIWEFEYRGESHFINVFHVMALGVVLFGGFFLFLKLAL